MCNDDALSCLPLPDCPTTVPMSHETIVLLEHLASVPLTVCKVEREQLLNLEKPLHNN